MPEPKSWKEPFDSDAVAEFFVVVGTLYAETLLPRGTRGLPHPDSPEVALDTFERLLRLSRDAKPSVADELDRLAVAFRAVLHRLLLDESDTQKPPQ